MYSCYLVLTSLFLCGTDLRKSPQIQMHRGEKTFHSLALNANAQGGGGKEALCSCGGYRYQSTQAITQLGNNFH